MSGTYPGEHYPATEKWGFRTRLTHSLYKLYHTIPRGVKEEFRESFGKRGEKTRGEEGKRRKGAVGYKAVDRRLKAEGVG